MEVFVEVYDVYEVSVVLKSGVRIVGVNNWNLHMFEVDLNVSEILVEHILIDVV